MFTWNNNNNKTERASKWAQRHTASKMSGKGKRKRIHWKLKFRFSWAPWIGCINSVWSVERLPQRCLWNRENEKNWWQRWSIVPRSCERIPIGKTSLWKHARAHEYLTIHRVDFAELNECAAVRLRFGSISHFDFGLTWLFVCVHQRLNVFELWIGPFCVMTETAFRHGANSNSLSNFAH